MSDSSSDDDVPLAALAAKPTRVADDSSSDDDVPLSALATAAKAKVQSMKDKNREKRKRAEAKAQAKAKSAQRKPARKVGAKAKRTSSAGGGSKRVKADKSGANEGSSSQGGKSGPREWDGAGSHRGQAVEGILVRWVYSPLRHSWPGPIVSALVDHHRVPRAVIAAAAKAGVDTGDVPTTDDMVRVTLSGEGMKMWREQGGVEEKDGAFLVPAVCGMETFESGGVRMLSIGDSSFILSPGMPGMLLGVKGTNTGTIVDIRPQRPRPSTSYLMTLDGKTLQSWWVEAIEGQMEALKAKEGDDSPLLPALVTELGIAKTRFSTNSADREMRRH
jgi:hypothetical protein